MLAAKKPAGVLGFQSQNMGSYSYEWNELDSASFRKSEVFGNLKWKDAVNFSLSKLAAAPFAGPVAFAHVKDESGSPRRNFPISFHLPSGKFLAKIQWQNGEMLGMFWSNREELLCLQEDGKVFVYTMFGMERKSYQFSMGKEAQETKCVDWMSFESSVGTGLAVLTTSHRIFIVNNVYDPKVWRSSEITRRVPEKPSCWTILSGPDRNTKVVFVLGNEIFFMVQGQPAEQIIPAIDTPVRKYVRVAPSQDGEKLAFLSENGLVQVTSADLKRSYCECDSMVRSPPEAFLWCGSDAVALYYSHDNSLLLVGMYGGTLNFAFFETYSLAPEIDGIRLYSRTTQEFLSKVPDPVRAVYQIASNAPGALLLEASKKFSAGSYEAYDYLKMIETTLKEAIEQCIAAAGHEFIVESQKSLLKAASFGKTFAHDVSPDSLEKMCRMLRVLNAIRDRLFAIPLTYNQVAAMTEKVLVDRLISRREYPLAIKICEHLKFTKDEGVNRVLAHWASRTIEEQAEKQGDKRMPNEKLAEVIFQKFREYPGISYADVASKAARSNLKTLATLLLEHEPQLVKQVNILLKLDQHQKALSRATESGDPDLMYFVISRLRGKIEKSEFNLALRKFPRAFALYKQQCRAENPEQLLALCKQEDDFVGQALCHIQKASVASLFDVREKITELMEAEKCMAGGKEELFAQQLNEHCRLLRYQADFETSFGDSFIDLSLKETLILLIEKDQPSRAEALKKEFKVTDKQFWWWKTEALARSKKVEQLEAFAKSKKSPIGYLPFIDLLVKYNREEDARRFIPRLQGLDKVKGFTKMNLLKEAAQVAFEQGDEDGLNYVLSRCGLQNRGLSDQIVQMKQQLATKKK